MLEANPSELEMQMNAFADRIYDIPEDVTSHDPKEINSLALIYNKPQEVFTKDLNYFVTQRFGQENEGN